MTGQTATGGSVRSRPRGILGGSRAGWAPIAVIAAVSTAGLLLAIGPASAQTITSKRAQAEAIMAEVESMNVDLEQAIEAYNYANIELDRIDSDLASNAKHLVAARKSLVVSQKRIAERLRDLYVNGEGDSTLEVILGSSSLDDIIARLDAIERVSSQDTHILRTVKQYRKEVETRRSNLRDAREDQARIVAEQAAQKQSIESQIAEQNQLLASVKDEIAEMRAEERGGRPRSPRRRSARAQAAGSGACAAGRPADVRPAALDRAGVRPEPSRAALRPRRRDRAAVPRHPVRVGRLEPVDGLRLLRASRATSSRRSACRSRTTPPRSTAMGTPVPTISSRPATSCSSAASATSGIYIGNDQFVHAPHTGDVVRISYLSERAGSFVGARRL